MNAFHRSPSAEKRRTHFTLIELLVVVAIIAILAGMLLPALGAAREMGKRANCQSNIHQLALAAHQYGADAKGYYPVASWNYCADNLHRWHGTRKTQTEPFANAGGSLTPYLAGGKVKSCPSFVFDKTDNYSVAFEAGCGGYGYNQDYIGGSYGISGAYASWPPDASVDYPALDSQLADPSRKLMFSDSAYFNAYSGQLLVEYSFITEPYFENGGYAGNPTNHFRHNGNTCNAGWADGHATAENIGCYYDSASGAYGSRKLAYIGQWKDNRLYDRKPVSASR